jgi:hypothetical protein
MAIGDCINEPEFLFTIHSGLICMVAMPNSLQYKASTLHIAHSAHQNALLNLNYSL